MTGEPRLSGTELLDEVEWLLDGSMHPLLVAQELHRSVASIEKAARDHGRRDIASHFWAYLQERKAA